VALHRRRPVLEKKVVQEILPEEVAMNRVRSPEMLQSLQSLVSWADTPLATLPSEQCEKLAELKNFAKGSYGTPAYSYMYQLISSMFAGTYQPHTVGSFFVGCIMNSSTLDEATAGVNRSCSLLCSEALPIPQGFRGQDWKFCSQNVILVLKRDSEISRKINSSIHYNNLKFGEKNDMFQFLPMTKIPSSTKGILYVDYLSYDDFPGFSVFEKARLIYSMNITDIKLLSYEKTGTEYRDLLGKPLKVREIKHRPDPRDSETPEQRASRRSKLFTQPVSVNKPAPVDDAAQPMSRIDMALVFGAFLTGLMVIIVLGMIIKVRFFNPAERGKARLRHG
jgi:hypothetical protein